MKGNAILKLKDKLWLWGQTANIHREYLPRDSRMTPVEGALYFGLERCCRVVMHSLPKPPFDQDSLAMRPLKEVVWSIVGAGCTVEHNNGKGDLEEVLRQAAMFPNITGGILDDFCSPERIAAFPPERLHMIRKQLHEGPRPLDLWVVVYEYQLEDQTLAPYLAECDVVTFWTWYGKHLSAAPGNFNKLRKLAPGKRYLSGCYMFEYPGKREVTRDEMKFQLDWQLDAIRGGESDGMILCSNCVADIGLDAVEYTRERLLEAGEEEL